MPSALRLIMPDLAYLSSYVDALREGFVFGTLTETATEEMLRKIRESPEDHLREKNVRDGKVQAPDGKYYERVPGVTLWLVENETFLGEFSIRYKLSAFLEHYAGHIGYGIRPSQRGRGYASAGLRLALKHLAEQGVASAFLTCDDSNTASAKVIEKAGGVLRDVVAFSWHNELVRRYDVPTENSRNSLNVLPPMGGAHVP